jgi:hypothetical protein
VNAEGIGVEREGDFLGATLMFTNKLKPGWGILPCNQYRC